MTPISDPRVQSFDYNPSALLLLLLVISPSPYCPIAFSTCYKRSFLVSVSSNTTTRYRPRIEGQFDGSWDAGNHHVSPGPSSETLGFIIDVFLTTQDVGIATSTSWASPIHLQILVHRRAIYVMSIANTLLNLQDIDSCSLHDPASGGPLGPRMTTWHLEGEKGIS